LKHDVKYKNHRSGHTYFTPKLKRPNPLRKLFEKSKISGQNHRYWAKVGLEFCKERPTVVGMNPKAENSCVVRRAPCAVRRAKLSKQTAPSKSEKNILELDNTNLKFTTDYRGA
jgi:hypothetical protein